ncbi:hypothetical protein C2E23DRAFT_738151 [Lenzites betulinus]|nr:hypothetical protein C2E23DRAFT_738151 [Lenzites betulinus]
MPTLLVDIDPEQALRVEQELYAQRRRQLQEISQEIDGICRSAWYEFYAREPFQCAQLLGSLEVATPQPPSSSDDLLEDAEPIDVDVSPNAAAFQLWSASLARPSGSSVKAGPSLPTLCPYAYPKYESCTPSIEIARYTADQRIVRFVPYADELGLDIEKYCKAHMEIGWQTEWFDIDFKLIAADTLLRLEALELNHDKINQLKPEFIPLLGTGFIANLRKRDILGWGSEALQNAQAISVPTTPNILAEVNSLVAHFCSSLNCNKARCMFHEYISERMYVFDGDDGGNKLVDAQEMVHNLRGLNYSFTLDETHFLDAATIGDMLRYINDPREEEKANVTAVSRIVAGQTKILFHSSEEPCSL